MIRSVSCGQRSLAGSQNLGDDLVFARRGPDFEPLVVLELADLRDDLGAAIEQADEVLIKPVDLASQDSRDWAGAWRQSAWGPEPDPSGSGKADCVLIDFRFICQLGKRRSEGSFHALPAGVSSGAPAARRRRPRSSKNRRKFVSNK